MADELLEEIKRLVGEEYVSDLHKYREDCLREIFEIVTKEEHTDEEWEEVYRYLGIRRKDG